MRLRLVGGHSDEHDEIGRVAGGCEHAASCGCAVDGALVVLVLGQLGGLARLEQHDTHRREERLGRRLGEQHGGHVHACALEEEAGGDDA